MNTVNINGGLSPVAEMAALSERVEWAAQAVVMLDNRDLPALATLAKHLRGIGNTLSLAIATSVAGEAEESAAGLDRCRQAAMAAAQRLENIILEQSDHPDDDLEAVCQTVSTLQSRLCHNRPQRFAEEAPVQDAQVAAMETGNPKADGGSDADGRTAYVRQRSDVVDDELFAAFIAQQQSVLPEIDEAILAFEKDGSPNHIAGLRRTIHTMKGESGVCGVSDIATACHQLEDYLEGGFPGAGKSGVSVDVLFEFKDWLEKAIEALGSGKVPEGLGDILMRQRGEGERQESGPAGRHEVDAKTGASPAVPAATAVPAGMPATVPIGDRELAVDFVGEAQEHFDSADENLLRLESDPTNRDAIGAVFRAFHTIKGVSGFIGLTPIGDLAHAAETLLDDVRKEKRRFSGVVVEVTFNALDMLKQMMADLKAALVAGTDIKVRPELPMLIALLNDVLAGKETTVAASLPTPKETGRGAVSLLGEEEAPVAAAPGSSAQKDAPPREGIEVGQTMKVDAEKIDLLLDTIGELVIAESIVASDPDIRALKSIRLEKNMSLLGKITRSLQDMGMAMRLVPIEATFRKMARLVRDLSKKSGKQVELIMEGGETEIDKSMVEKLGDPLVHMIRNSMDHGVESNEERQAKGKDPVGHVTLRAHHKGGSIHIDIEDDGKGLDREAIVAKAIEKGLLATGAGVPDQDVFALIFAAGFSTAKQITEISGRGVGMDVVRRNIESLRGNVLIKSRQGQGTTFTIVLPLTMAIIDGMLAKVSSEIYVLPTLSIVESFRPSADMVTTVTGKGEMVAFRSALLPLFRLADIFRVSGAIGNPPEAIVMVVEDAGKQWGLLVDEILGQQQIVIKSLGDAMGIVPGVSGASIMADGRPGLILDIGGVIRLATE